MSKAKWISVNDKMPELGQKVWVWPGDRVAIYDYYGTNRFDDKVYVGADTCGVPDGPDFVARPVIPGFPKDADILGGSVTHWMPRPEPPSYISGGYVAGGSQKVNRYSYVGVDAANMQSAIDTINREVKGRIVCVWHRRGNPGRIQLELLVEND